MSDPYNKIHIVIVYAYSSQIYETDITVSITNNQLNLNEIIEELKTNDFKIPDTTVISVWDRDLQYFIHCGITPLDTYITIPKSSNVSKSITQVKIKLRQIIKKDNLMKLELIEDNNENIDENNQNMFINNKSKRSKERKIGYIIEKVYLWRRLYNGFEDENGNVTKLTLEEAANKVGISKKSLDDYLIQLRIGRQHGFPFSEHSNDKVGKLRAFVKQIKWKETTQNHKTLSIKDDDNFEDGSLD
jgi:hypothetical protein